MPFYLTSGKRLTEKLTRITINFREVPHSLFRRVLGEDIQTNRLVLDIQPKEEITLYFQAKQPGAQVGLRTVRLHFSYQDQAGRQGMEAYEKALVDAMLGDQMLFWRQDGVELCWAFWTRCWRPASNAATGPTVCTATGRAAGAPATRPSSGPATPTTTRWSRAMRVEVFEDQAALSRATAEFVRAAALRAVEARGFSLALAGGSTPWRLIG